MKTAKDGWDGESKICTGNYCRTEIEWGDAIQVKDMTTGRLDRFCPKCIKKHDELHVERLPAPTEA